MIAPTCSSSTAGAAGLQVPDDVTLADDALDAAVPAGHHEGADPVLGQHVEQRADRFVGCDGDDEVTLASQHVRDPHGRCTSVSLTSGPPSAPDADVGVFRR